MKGWSCYPTLDNTTTLSYSYFPNCEINLVLFIFHFVYNKNENNLGNSKKEINKTMLKNNISDPENIANDFAIRFLMT